MVGKTLKEKFIKQVTLEEESRQTVKTRVKMLWVSEDKMRELNYTAKLDLFAENKLCLMNLLVYFINFAIVNSVLSVPVPLYPCMVAPKESY